MASSYIAIEFNAPGPDFFARSVARIDAIPATELIFERGRELPWYERQELFGRELACRVVVWVHDALVETESEREHREADPYRKLEIYDIEYEVPVALADMIDALGGRCSIVDRGCLRFVTRRYEPSVRDQLAADIEAAARSQARSEFGVERERLVARIEGAILKIHEIERLVRRSGLVDPDELVVDYL